MPEVQANPYRRDRRSSPHEFSADEHRALQLLQEEYRKVNMDSQALNDLTSGFFHRRDSAAVRAIVKAMEEARN